MAPRCNLAWIQNGPSVHSSLIPTPRCLLAGMGSLGWGAIWSGQYQLVRRYVMQILAWATGKDSTNCMSNPPSNQWLFGARLAKLACTQKRLLLKLHGIGVEANKENAAQWQKLTSPGLLESEKIRSTRFKPIMWRWWLDTVIQERRGTLKKGRWQRRET